MDFKLKPRSVPSALLINKPRVTIVLSTFNGEHYLAQQLNSICNQTFSNWQVLIRDDGSNDNTRQIIDNFIKLYPEKFRILSYKDDNIGIVASYSILVQSTNTHYILFCDQDDVWLPDKIKYVMCAMINAEYKYGTFTPILIHTDLHIVDKNLQNISYSLWNYQGIKPHLDIQPYQLLAQNEVTGCTILINRPLAMLAAPFPKEAVMHDWWLALVASLFGHIIPLNKSKILYRQHSKNSIGANKWNFHKTLYLFHHAENIRTNILLSIQQAQAILDNYHEQINLKNKEQLIAYASLPYQTRFERLCTILTHHFFKQGVVRTIGFVLHIIMLPYYTKKNID